MKLTLATLERLQALGATHIKTPELEITFGGSNRQTARAVEVDNKAIPPVEPPPKPYNVPADMPAGAELADMMFEEGKAHVLQFLDSEQAEKVKAKEAESMRTWSS